MCSDCSQLPEGHLDGYDESIQTPSYAVDPETEANPNPNTPERVTLWDDGPIVDGGHAPGAVNEIGAMLRADGSVAAPKGGE